MAIANKLAERTKFSGDWRKENEHQEKMMKGIGDVLNIANCVWPPEHALPEHITRASKEVIDKKPHYQFLGLPELKLAIAEKLERENGVEVNPDTQVLVTTGAQEAIYLAIFTFVDHGDEVVMGNPTYTPGYETNISMAGGRPAYVPAKEERNFELDPEDLEKKLTKNTKSISIISPENPTGAVMNKGDLEVIAEIAKKRDLVVFSNEVYEKLVYDGRKNISIASLPGMEDRTLTINGFSKCYDMDGHRIGYVVGPEAAVRKMESIQAHLTVCANDVGQHAALAALTGTQDWIEKAVKEFEKRRKLLVNGLNHINKIKCRKPEGGMFAFPNIKEFGVSSAELTERLLTKARVWVFPGTDFGVYGEGYLRISFLRSQKTLTEALDRMKMTLESL